MTGYYIKLYLISLVVFLAIDMLWLTLVAKNFYNRQLGYLMSPKPNLIAAGVFYLLFVAGLLVFVVVPGLQAGSLSRTLFLAALFGLVCYATYDLTNLATVKDWPLAITLVDLLWGTSVSVLVSLVIFLVGRWIG